MNKNKGHEVDITFYEEAAAIDPIILYPNQKALKKPGKIRKFFSYFKLFNRTITDKSIDIDFNEGRCMALVLFILVLSIYHLHHFFSLWEITWDITFR